MSVEQQQFVLRWHYQEVTLVRNLSCLLENEVLTDCTLSVGSHNLKAHRLVLAMCSVYFFQLFQEMGDTQHPVIVLHNVEIDDIKAVLSFIYRGQCVVSKDQLPGLLSVAKLLKIQGLCDMKVPERNIVQNSLVSANFDSPPLDNNTTESKCNVNNNPSSNNNGNGSSSSSNNEEKENGSKEKRVSPPPRNSLYWDKSTPVFPENPPKLDPNYLPLLRRPSKDSSETCKCFLCGKYLSNQYNLRVHMETHEEAYHACQSCPHVSRSRDALRKHVSYRHPEEYHTRKRKKLE